MWTQRESSTTPIHVIRRQTKDSYHTMYSSANKKANAATRHSRTLVLGGGVRRSLPLKSSSFYFPIHLFTPRIPVTAQRLALWNRGIEHIGVRTRHQRVSSVEVGGSRFIRRNLACPRRKILHRPAIEFETRVIVLLLSFVLDQRTLEHHLVFVVASVGGNGRYRLVVSVLCSLLR